jgi:integrase
LIVSGRFDDGGKRIQHHRTVDAANRAAAERKLREFCKEIDDGLCAKSGDQTLKIYMERWLAEQTAGLAPATLRRYRRDVERFIVPTLGALRLSELKARHLNKAYHAWQQERQDGREGILSPQTVLHVHRVLHRALGDWIREEGNTRPNPCDYVRKPKAEEHERSAFTKEQARDLLDASKDTPLEAAVALGLGCGLRRNELLGLRWRDVDLARSTIVVAQSLDYDPTAPTGKRFSFKQPKSNRARAVALPAFVADALRRHRVEQARERVCTLVLADEHGQPIDPGRLASAFRQLLKRTGLPDAGPHAMRHTFATLALSAGQNPLAISKALGHYDPGFTLRVYAHVEPGVAAQVASAMNDVLQSPHNEGGPVAAVGAKRLPQ